MTALPISDLEDLYDDDPRFDPTFAQHAIASQRLAEMEADPELGYTFEEFQERLRNRCQEIAEPFTYDDGPNSDPTPEQHAIAVERVEAMKADPSRGISFDEAREILRNWNNR
jgi:hypothetical protein